MSTETLLLLILIVFILGAIPAWPYSREWGYGPSGILTVIIVIFLVWAVAENRPLFRSNTASDTIHQVGHDIKDAGRKVADSVNDAVR